MVRAKHVTLTLPQLARDPSPIPIPTPGARQARDRHDDADADRHGGDLGDLVAGRLQPGLW